MGKVELGPGGNGTVDYHNDARGNAVKKEIRPNNGTDHPLRYVYDPAGRLIRVDEKPDTGTTWKVLKEFFYGRKNAGNNLRAGKLVMAKRTNWLKVLAPLDPLADPEEQPIVVSDHFTYTEPGGRLSRKRTSITVGPGTSSWTSQFTYDKLGNLRTIRYPECQGWPCRSGRPDPERLVAFDYREGFLTDIGNYSAQENPSAEALSSFSDGAYASAIEYQLGGMLHEISYGNGVKWSQSVAPNHMSRPHQITTTGLSPIPPSPTPGNNTEPESANWSTGTYGYDAAGNISKIGDFSYQYDAFHRLKEEEESFFPRQSAVFDPYGNLTQLTTLSAVESMPTNTSTNRLVGATFDDAGNLTSITLGQEQQFDYDGLGMLKTQQTPSGVRAYLYDASDERVMRWDCPLDECGPDTSKEHITIRGLNGEVLRVYEGTERADRKWKEDTVYRDGQPLIRIQDGGQGTQKLHALHHDHLGSVRQVTNWLGEEVSRHRYYPFGKEATPVASSDPAHKFTGHERDEGFQAGEPLDYMHARYCSPVLGRFLSVDPVGGNPKIPQGWNRYSYTHNSPVRYSDPDGRLRRDTSGKLVVKLGEVSGRRTRSGNRYRVQNVTLFANNGTPIKAHSVLTGTHGVGDIITATGRRYSDPTSSNPLCTDCHGVTFADGDFWIENNQVDSILTGDGYEKVDGAAKGGDIVIYRQDGRVAHSATVVSIDKDGKPVLVKGLAGEQVSVSTNPVGPGEDTAWESEAEVEIYRKGED